MPRKPLLARSKLPEIGLAALERLGRLWLAPLLALLARWKSGLGGALPRGLAADLTVDEAQRAYYAALERYAGQMELRPIRAGRPTAAAPAGPSGEALGASPSGSDYTAPIAFDSSPGHDDEQLYEAVEHAYTAWCQALRRAELGGAAAAPHPAPPAATGGAPVSRCLSWRRAPAEASGATTLRGLYPHQIGRFNEAIVVLLAAALFLAGRSVGDTIAYFTSAQDVPGNTLSSAKLFAPTDISAVAKSGGDIAVSWSKISWATNGYSVRRGTSAGGPFTQVGTTDANTLIFTDTTANGLVNGTTYYYVIRGLSGLGGDGVDTSVASAKSDLTAPTVSSTSPAEAATDVSVGTAITVTFSEAMNQSLTANSFALVRCTDGTSACSSPSAALSGVTSWQANNTCTSRPRRR